MSRFSRWVKLVASCFVAVVTTGSARAAVVINFSEVGSNISVTLSGSLSNLSPLSNNSDVIANYAFQSGGGNVFSISTTGGIQQIYTMTRTSGPSTPWSSATSFFETLSNVTLSGLSKFGILANGSTGTGQMNLIGYNAGDTITGQSLIVGKTLAGLQLPTSFTEFVYTLDNGGDTVTVQFGSPSGGGGGAVPEPTSLAIFGLGAIGAAIRARRFRVQATG
jgi:hypothetical protein